MYVRLNFTQPLCACPGRYRDPCSASINKDDLHTTELVTDPRGKVSVELFTNLKPGLISETPLLNVLFLFFDLHGAIGCSQKSCILLWRYLSVFLAKGHLPRVSLRSRGSLRVILKINYLLSFCYLSPYIPFHQPMQCCNSSGFAKMPLYYRGHLLLRSEMVR